MAALHPGFAEVPVVEHDDRQIARLLYSNRPQAADTHELLAIAGDHQHGLVRLRKGEAEGE